MAGPFESPDQTRSRGQGRRLRELVRYAIGICLGIVVLLLLFGKRGELVDAWHQAAEADLRWLLGATGAEVASLASFAWLQHRVLKLSGASISVRESAALTLANHAIANTVPGEPVVSSAYRYRYCRRHGVNEASAGWTIFTMLVAQAIAMSLILLLGVLVALLASTSVLDTGVTIAGLVIIAAAGAVLVRRDLMLRFAGALPRAVRQVTGHRYATVETMTTRVEATFARMRQIPLSARSAVSVVAIAALVWLADLGCLIFAFGAVRADVPWDGVLLAYGVAQVAGSLPVVPGGIGIIEGSLAVVMIGYGTEPVPALAAALVYRIIAFWLESAVGWVAVGVIAHRTPHRTPHRTGHLARRSAGEKPELSQEPACAGGSPSRRDSSAVPLGHRRG